MGGLDPALAAVLHELGCTGPIRVSVLAEAMRLDQSTVSRHVSAPSRPVWWRGRTIRTTAGPLFSR